MAFYSQICISQIRFYLSVSLYINILYHFYYSSTRRSIKNNRQVKQLNINGISKTFCLYRWCFMAFYRQIRISKISGL